ncbi:MAG: PEP-CTERM sorting domain-containing protein [Gammaproteobacteria bacterium]
MRTKIFTAAAIALVMSLTGAANAAFIDGAITMSGDFVPTGGTNLGDATGIDFLGDDFNIDDVSGDFALAGIAVGDAGTYTDFQFNPLIAPVNPLWSISGFSFALEDISIVFQNAAFLVLQGSGTISGAGFDDTAGTWNMTANAAGTLFNFSAGSTATGIDEPSVLALIGLGLLGFSARRKLAR